VLKDEPRASVVVDDREGDHMLTQTVSGFANPLGLLTLTVPVDVPSVEYEAIVMVRSKDTREGRFDKRWLAVDAIRDRLKSGGMNFSESCDLIREDRDR
jgi:hypothetical protein